MSGFNPGRSLDPGGTIRRVTSGTGLGGMTPVPAADDVAFTGHEGTDVDAALDARPPVHLSASSDPAVGDDDADGHVVGCRWINLTSGEEFVAVDVSTGAAVWTSTTSASGISDIDDLPTAETDTSKVLKPDGVGGVAWGTDATGGGGGGSDPIADVFGTPDTAFEFDTSSLTGLTALGTVAAEDADTTVPGHYYLRNNTNASPYWRGRGVAVTTPFTAICKVNCTSNENYEGAGMLYAPSTYPSSGALEILAEGNVNGNAQRVGLERWTGPGTYGSGIANHSAAVPSLPVYMAVRAASSTDVSTYWSFDGGLWFALAVARNPSFTVALIGLVSSAQNTNGFSAIYDFLRIWNSAKTFLT